MYSEQKGVIEILMLNNKWRNSVLFLRFLPWTSQLNLQVLLVIDPAQHAYIQSHKVRTMSPLRPCVSEVVNKTCVDSLNTNLVMFPVQR